MNRRVLLGIGAVVFAVWSLRGQMKLHDALDRQAEATARLASNQAAQRAAPARPVVRVIERDNCPAWPGAGSGRDDAGPVTDRAGTTGGAGDTGAGVGGDGAGVDAEQLDRIDRAGQLVDDAIAAGRLDGPRAADIQAALTGLDRDARFELVLRMTRAANAGQLAIADRRGFPM